MWDVRLTTTPIDPSTSHSWLGGTLLEKKHKHPKILQFIFFSTLSLFYFGREDRCKMKDFLTMEAIKPKQKCWSIHISLCWGLRTPVRSWRSLWTKSSTPGVRTRALDTGRLHPNSAGPDTKAAHFFFSLWCSLSFSISEIGVMSVLQNGDKMITCIYK